MITNNPGSHLDILLVLYREIDDIQTLYEILKNQSFQNFRVLVSLNDPTEEIISKLPHDDKWFYFEGPNNGYAGGLERLREHVTSEWVLCSNTDLTFNNKVIEDFVEAANNCDEDIGYLGPKILFADGRLQCAAGLLLGPEGLCKPRGIGDSDNCRYDHLSRVPVLSGCCFMFRSALLNDLGGFDSKFFMYVEDVHLFLRAVWAGWMGQYLPHISIVHEHGGSNERYGHLHLYHLERNHWWVSPQLPLSRVLLKPFYLVQRWLLLAFFNKGPSKGKMPSDSSKIAIKALVHGLLGLPRQYMKPSYKKITTKQFNAIFKEHRIGMKEFLSK